jgi:hypothetical protein
MRITRVMLVEMATIMSIPLFGSGKILKRSLEVLANLKHAWPQATTWLEALRKVSFPVNRSKGHERPISEMSSQERVLSAAASSSLYNIRPY